MAINPLIAMSGRGVDVGKAFSNALVNIERKQNIQTARQQAPLKQRALAAEVGTREAAVPTQQDRFNTAEVSRISSLAQGARSIIPDLESGNIEQAITTMTARGQRLQAAGIDTADTAQAIRLAQTNPQQLLTRARNVVARDDQINKSGKQTAFQFGAQQTVKDPDGNLFQASQRRNPADGSVETVLSPIGGGAAQPTGPVNLVSPSGETPAEQLITRGKQADIDVTKARKTERVKLKEKRSSEITKELSQRNRDAARAGRTTRKALTLARQSSQGFTGAATLQLSRLIPGIDASDEAALDAALKELALVQLQQFKGPTTDFEFGVTQSIAGSLGQSEAANIARLNSLDRATWFNQREFNQFEAHRKSGGDPDSFKFNFGEPIKTKKGVFTLQDIQDTAVERNQTIQEVLERLNR